jgi:putative PIN family toxin of toxin-antitoxin system
MIVLLDSNIFLSALISPKGAPRTITDEWLDGRFELLTCPEQIEEIRAASRYPKLRTIIQPNRVGKMINNLYRATVWDMPLPRKHQSADPTDDYLLNLMGAAQPDYAVTGDHRSGLLTLQSLGRTRILTAREFCDQVLR